MQSLMFKAYNLLRKANETNGLDPERMNRALGILQSKGGPAKLEWYETSLTDCWCPDHIERKVVCKHMIAWRMLRLMEMIDGKNKSVH